MAFAYQRQVGLRGENVKIQADRFMFLVPTTLSIEPLHPEVNLGGAMNEILEWDCFNVSCYIMLVIV